MGFVIIDFFYLFIYLFTYIYIYIYILKLLFILVVFSDALNNVDLLKANDGTIIE